MHDEKNRKFFEDCKERVSFISIKCIVLCVKSKFSNSIGVNSSNIFSSALCGFAQKFFLSLFIIIMCFACFFSQMTSPCTLGDFYINCNPQNSTDSRILVTENQQSENAWILCVNEKICTHMKYSNLYSFFYKE